MKNEKIVKSENSRGVNHLFFSRTEYLHRPDEELGVPLGELSPWSLSGL
jgi:hypothetical protein